ncbi:MAG TPA: GH3 auxin-responsive promoter family protein [Bdellovibrionota bacterium]|nr:GH3 auxin-responsive promoter family protein [Bdellovibrionota bacterium]
MSKTLTAAWGRSVGLGLRAAWGPKLAEVDFSALDPAAAQERAFRRILAECGAGEAGRAWGLHEARSFRDLRFLPTTDSKSLAPWVARVREGGRAASGVFGRSLPLALGQTSGTTGEPKRFPITREFLASYRRSSERMNAAWVAHTGRWDHVALGLSLMLTARPEAGRGPGGLPEGFMSGIMAEAVPLWIRHRTLPSRRLMREGEWDTKLDRVLDQARGRNVQLVAGVPPLFLAFAERALERFGAASLREIWPELRTFYFGGMALSSRLEATLRRVWGRDDLIFWEMYAATEGQFGHRWRGDLPGMVFTSLENVFLFSETPGGPLVALDEVRAGRRYGVVVTTPGGLVNYRMGDVVEILSERPLTFRVCGRENEEISLAGEKIATEQTEKALEWAVGRVGQRFSDYVLWAEEGRPHRLVWGLPSNGSDDTPAGPELAVALDEGLAAANPTYAEMRKQDFLFRAPRVVTLPPNLFTQYRDRNLDRGQFKGRRLFRDEVGFRTEYGVTSLSKD